MLAALCAAALQDKLPRVLVDRDDVEVRSSCVLECSGRPIVDVEGDGVVKLLADGITVVFSGAGLVGAPPGAAADTFTGIGVSIAARDVTLRGALVRGFKCGILARGADGLVLEGCDVSGNHRDRLRSTPAAEAGEDWLWPHKNDADEWLASYGAGIYVAESKGVTIRACRAREGQNGIALRRVDGARIHDNDMSWLSGWGLAMFRSSGNVVDHNSFDFCIRGYSHGVYARGQDSAGILCFEQCCDNLFAYNSATHGGDGFFGFAGLEALEGDVQQPGVGCNRNVLYGNDFSYAAAIGIEMTFSYDNVYASNRLVGSNYGVWGGYSGRTRIHANEIGANALAGVAIEHGSNWVIDGNRFARNERALELWWDDDKDLLAKPWAKLNPTASADYLLQLNRFEGDKVQLELRGGTTDVRWNLLDPGTDKTLWRVDAASRVEEFEAVVDAAGFRDARLDALPGKRRAVGALERLAGRDKIIVTEWGPYDWVAPLLQRVDDRGATHVWRLLGDDVAIGADAGAEVELRMDASAVPPLLLVSPRKRGAAVPYTLTVRVPSHELSGSGVLLDSPWRVTVGKWTTDPREDAAAWRREVEAGVSFDAPRLVLRYSGGGPGELADVPREVVDAALGRDRFGTLATTRLALPKGRWKLSTTSDDGVRVRVDGRLVIDNWSWHGPTVDSAELAFEADAEHDLAVEHFELDGWAVLELALAPLP